MTTKTARGAGGRQPGGQEDTGHKGRKGAEEAPPPRCRPHTWAGAGWGSR